MTTHQPPLLDNQKPSFLADGMLIVLFIAFANLLLHLYFGNRYGYFRDEFDYMACGDHPAWGYVDHPPLVPFLIKICRMIFGDSLRSIRLFPALASSANIILTAMIARELGGRRFALLLSAAVVAVAPVYLLNASILTTNYPEPLLWMGCAYFAILAIKRNEPRYWLWFGLVRFRRGDGARLTARLDGPAARRWPACLRRTARGDVHSVVDTASHLQLPLEQVESKMLLLSHSELMQRVLTAWKFPEALVEPISMHHLSLGNIRSLALESSRKSAPSRWPTVCGMRCCSAPAAMTANIRQPNSYNCSSWAKMSSTSSRREFRSKRRK